MALVVFIRYCFGLKNILGVLMLFVGMCKGFFKFA